MKDQQIICSYQNLKKYCEKEGYKGWDPYDGLNSKLFRAILPLKHSALLRLCIIQGFKRNPINFRKIALVPKQHNAKGIGLFLQGYCNLAKVVKSLGSRGELDDEIQEALGTEEEINGKINYLADLLISMQSKGDYHGTCWGYNFDWQARRLFLFPAYTPTVVATNFCATALMDAYEVTKEKKYLDVALSAAEFVINDLHRHETPEGFLFSYSPLQGNDTVYNASLLGSKLLSYCYKYTGKEEYKELAEKSVKACCAGQREDGAWVYGLLPVQNWVDSFHTGYNLDGLIAYQEQTGDTRYNDYIEKGFDYYIKNMFEADGTPKYYDIQMYPIDIHCPGQLFVTLHRLHKTEQYRDLEDKVMNWVISNMQDKKGYFYYQLKKGMSSKIPYMRWSNAFMFNAMSYYLLDNI